MTVTLVPPAVLPEEVPRLVIAGALAALYVNRSDEEVAEVPDGVVTVTSTAPA